MTPTPASAPTTLGRFSEIPANSLTQQQQEIVKSFVDRRGTVPGPFRIFLSSPDLAERLRNLSDYVLRHGLLSQREVETAVLVTAQKLGASYIEAAHRRIAASAGMAAKHIEAILAGCDPEMTNAREQAVYECAFAMHQGSQNDAKFERITDILGNDGVCEVAAVLGFYCTCAFTLGFFEAPAPK